MKKYLSDGTLVKVGLIVTCLKGDSFGLKAKETSKITRIQTDSYGTDIGDDQVMCFDRNSPADPWYEYAFDLRKATPDEEAKFKKLIGK